MAIHLKSLASVCLAIGLIFSGMVTATNVSAQMGDGDLEAIMEDLMEDIDRDVQRDITQNATQETQEIVQEDVLIPDVVETGVGDPTTVAPQQEEICPVLPENPPEGFAISGETFDRCFGG
ncbi:MAG: hypothetical protein ACE5EK_03225 [Nitrospinales bacterium]